MERAMLFHRVPLRLAARFPLLSSPPPPPRRYHHHQQCLLSSCHRCCCTQSISQASDSTAAIPSSSLSSSSSPRNEYRQLEYQLLHGYEANTPPSTLPTVPLVLLPSSTSITSPSLEKVSFCTIASKFLECCEVGEKLNIGVLLSGGVDSSVALRLLLAAGHSCTAFYLKIWFQAGVNLQVVQLTKEYWEHVVSHMIAEYSAGRTPNPDVLCNSRIKFGVFLDHVKDMGFDRVASGHYAKVTRAGGETVLQLSSDEVKDQTYFLSHLSQFQLSKLTFPLGCLSKDEVRKIANDLGLPNKQRKDSQGICFLGKVKFSDFICRHLGERVGNILEAETGKYLGTHKGFWFYTIGQRQGLRLSDGPWYVVDKDLENNVVFVSKEYYSSDKRRRLFEVHTFNWLRGQPPKCFSGLKCKIRHGARFYNCSLSFQNLHSTSQTAQAADVALVKLSEDDQGIAAGQYAAFYKGDVCLGSAVISEFTGDQSSAVSSAAREAAKVKGVPLLSTRKSEKKKITSHQCDNALICKTAETHMPLKGPTWLVHSVQRWMKKCLDWLQPRLSKTGHVES